MKIGMDVVKRYMKNDFIGAIILGIIYFALQPRPGLYPQVLYLIFLILLIDFYFSKKISGRNENFALSLGRKLVLFLAIFALGNVILLPIFSGSSLMTLTYYPVNFYLGFIVNIVSLVILYWIFSDWSLAIKENIKIKLSNYKIKIIALSFLIFLKEAIVYFGLS